MKRVTIILMALLLACAVPADTTSADAWSSYRDITLQAAQIPAAQTDFPVLISITDSTNLKDTGNGGSVGQADGGDFRFTTGSSSPWNDELLDYEIEKYDNTNGVLVAWVKLPNLSASGSTIRMWYGNSSAPDGWNPTGVWSNGYEAVYHLHDDFNDSTGNGHTGTNSNSTDTSSGKIADAQDFEPGDGTVDHIDLGNWSVAGTTLTVQAWVNYDDFNNDDPRVISKANGSGEQDHVWMLSMIDPGENTPRFRLKTGASDSSGTTTLIATGYTVSVTTWHLIAIQYESPSMRIIRDDDGVIASTSKSGNLRENSWDIWIGDNPPGGTATARSHDGRIDEVRISTVARSADWITTEYNNQNNPASFLSDGGHQSAGGVDPVPELPTIILMSIGLIGLGIYLWLRRRRLVYAR